MEDIEEKEKKAEEGINHSYFKKMIQAYTDMVERLVRNTRPKTANRIRKEFDIPLFTQMVQNNAFDGQSMLGLVNTTFDWIKRLHCPARDKQADEAKARVMTCTTMDSVVPLFISEVNKCMDYMDEDMAEFLKHKDHPVMQETLRRMVNNMKK